MDHYIDIRLRPDPEFSPHQLLSALYAKLHRALVQRDNEDIGVSFPQHNEARPSLGTHMRLHGSSSSLESLMDIQWLHGMQGHVQLSPIAPVPSGAKHRRVTRVQVKSSPERRRRRAMRRHGIDADSAKQRIPDTAARTLQLPYVQLGSRSTRQASFPLFIQHGPVQPQPTSGQFNSYGLSGSASIPWF